ncbi:MAG: TIGR02996 domain-containing protein [Planctomycetia bacterium]|nr:TIGR02996 domain-containing protein [Planctomycetia bacterium]
MQTEAEAFLQRIRAKPDDDTQRLIFADWLDEQGDPRGRFIRVQLALAQLPEDDPARKQLHVIEQALLAAHREEWETPLRRLGNGFVFHRGFVDELNVDGRDFVRNAPEIFTVSPVRHVHLIDIGSHYPAVMQSPYLSRLSALTIHGQHTGEPLARAVARCEHLSGLKRLRLSNNRLGDDAIEHLITSPTLTNLEELDLSGNEVGETGARSLAASSLVKLQKLELRGNRLGPAGAESLAGSERLCALRQLGLSGNDVGIPRLHSLAHANNLLRVPILDLSRNGLTPASLQVIFLRPRSGDTSTVRLEALDLSGNELGDDGARVLAGCPCLEHVSALRLVHCEIGNEGVRALANSSHLGEVTLLDLQNNPFADQGCWALRDTSQLRSLRQLRLPRVGVPDRLRRQLEAKFNRPSRRE